MRKILILVLFAVVQIASAKATQAFGIKAGVNTAIYEKSSGNFVGFNGGILFQYRLDKKWGFSSEFTYSQHSNSSSYRDWSGALIDSVTVSETIDIDYIDLVLLVKFFPAKRFNINTGIQLGNFLTAQREIKAVTDGGKTYDELENLKDIANTAVGIPFGLEYQFEFGLALEARFTWGLLSIYESDASTKSKTLSLNAIYYF